MHHLCTLHLSLLQYCTSQYAVHRSIKQCIIYGRWWYTPITHINQFLTPLPIEMSDTNHSDTDLSHIESITTKKNQSKVCVPWVWCVDPYIHCVREREGLLFSSGHIFSFVWHWFIRRSMNILAGERGGELLWPCGGGWERRDGGEWRGGRRNNGINGPIRKRSQS